MKLMSFALVFSTIVLLIVVDFSNGCGFPMMGGGGCCCCGGGRKKREVAVKPHYRSDESPCPQIQWKSIIEKGILADDAESLVGRVQGALYNEFPGTKFLVSCTDLPPPIDAKDGAVQKAAGTLPKMQFMSSGDAYCTVQAQNVWCQAVAMTA